MNRHKLFTTKYMNMNMKLSDTNIKNSRFQKGFCKIISCIYVLPSPSRPLQSIDIKRALNRLIVPGYCYCVTPDLAWPRAE